MTTEDQRKILIAEDDEENCCLAKEAFKEAGTTAALAFVANGMELFDYLSARSDSDQQELPDIILFDLNMPKRRNGREALKKIKSKPALRHIPVVVLTAPTKERDITLNIKAGADGFITKPTTINEWKDIMKSVAKRWPLS